MPVVTISDMLGHVSTLRPVIPLLNVCSLKTRPHSFYVRSTPSLSLSSAGNPSNGFVARQRQCPHQRQRRRKVTTLPANALALTNEHSRALSPTPVQSCRYRRRRRRRLLRVCQNTKKHRYKRVLPDGAGRGTAVNMPERKESSLY